MCDPAESSQIQSWLLRPEDLDLCRARANRVARKYLASRTVAAAAAAGAAESTSTSAAAAPDDVPSSQENRSSSSSSTPIVHAFAKQFKDQKEKYQKEDADDDGPWVKPTGGGDDGGHPFINPDDEQLLVSFYASKIPSLIGPNAQLQDLLRQSKFPATAAMLFRRFYLSNSVLIHDPKVVMTSAAWLASKVEDRMVPIKWLEEGTNIMNSPVTRSEIIESEVHLLGGVDFDLLCFHPYKAVVAMTEDMKNRLKAPEAREFVSFPHDESNKRTISGNDLDPMYKCAIEIVNDVIVSDLPLLYTPGQLGLAALLLANEETTNDVSSRSRPQIDFMGYLKHRFDDNEEATEKLLPLLVEIRDKLKCLKDGQYGCGTYNEDLTKLKEVNKKLKKCRLWGQSSSSKSSKSKKKKKREKGSMDDGPNGQDGARKKARVENE